LLAVHDNGTYFLAERAVHSCAATLASSTRATRTSEAAQAISIWLVNAERENLKINTASDGVGSIGLGVSQYLLNSAVNKSGAVSPAARATASITPVSRPGRAVGSTTFQTTCVWVQPIPMAASRMRCGTILIACSAVKRIVGSIRIARAMPPAGAE